MGYPKDSLGYYVYFLVDPRVVVAKHTIFLEKAFIQEGGMGRKIDLAEKESYVPETPYQITKYGEMSHVIDPQIPSRSNRVSHPPDC